MTRPARRTFVTGAGGGARSTSTVERVTRPVERRVDPFGLGALVASGTLAGHELGYFIGGRSSVSHTYVDLIGPFVVLMGCLAAWLAALRILRDDAGRLPSVGVLIVAQTLAFTGMEVTERVVTDSLTSLASTPVVIGLLLQPLVALVAKQLLAVGERLVEAFRPVVRRAVSRSLVDTARPVAVLVSSPGLVRLRLRGPPV